MTQKSVAQAEQDAEAARARLENSLEALRESIRPSHLVDEAVAYARNNGGVDFAKNLGRQVRDNPLPVALIGTAIAWLMLGRKQSTASRRDIEPRYPSAHAVDDLAEPIASGVAHEASHLAGKVTDALDTAGARVTDAVDTASQAASQAARRASDTAGRVSEAVTDTTDRVRRGLNEASGHASAAGRKMRDGVNTIIEEQPLVLGALGLAVGAVVAAAMPSTRLEDRIAGKYSDDLKDELREAAAGTAARAASVAARAFDSADREGERAAQEEGLIQPAGASESGDGADIGRNKPV